MGTLTSWNPLGHSRPVTGLLYLLQKKYGVVSNFENTIHIVYAARRVAFPQKSIHMGSDHTNQPAVKVYCN